MKRLKLLGLCLLAMFAMIATFTVQAATGETTNVTAASTSVIFGQILSTAFWSALGTLLLVICFKIVDAFTPGKLADHIFVEKNVAAGVLAAGAMIGAALIVAASIVG